MADAWRRLSIFRMLAVIYGTLVLREVHEFSYREIAEVIGVPIETVMSRLYRARSGTATRRRRHRHGVCSLTGIFLLGDDGSSVPS